jgi:uncharacterized protein (TIGR03435 family)
MNAKAERASSIDDLHTMLKNLLADEFKLQIHRETKEVPVYALVTDKEGAKMNPNEASTSVETVGKTWINIDNESGQQWLKTK